MKRLLLVLCLMVAALPVAAQRGGADAPRELEIGETVEASIENAIHTYTFSARAQQLIIFDLVSDDFDPFLQIEDAEGDVLVSDDDSGDGLYSRAVFVAPTTGEFQATVKSFSGNATGSYTLFSSADSPQLVFGETVQVEVPMEGEVTLFFVGEAGQTVTVTGVGAQDADTTLTLFDKDGTQIAYNDDFDSLNPTLYRITLPETGVYTVVFAPLGDDDGGLGTVTLTNTPIVMIGAEPTIIKLGPDGTDRDIFGFEVEGGERYLITATTDILTSGYFTVLQGTESYGSTSVNYSGVYGVSFVYEANEGGVLRLEVRDSGYQSNVTYTITVETLE
ncbi:MAG: hypothetical protein MUF38_11705 [Anaerolineae bacterium]|nr:hypothetical protein [Anaerolineae bacterium]